LPSKFVKHANMTQENVFFSQIPFSFLQPSSFWPRHCEANWPTYQVLGVGGSGAETVGPALQVDFLQAELQIAIFGIDFLRAYKPVDPAAGKLV
jgi:hypothetical protein